MSHAEGVLTDALVASGMVDANSGVAPPGLDLASFEKPITLRNMTEADFERVASIVNAMPEVAHNYQRAHALNMWFVLATETPDGIQAAISRIEAATGNHVINVPKEREYFVGARFQA